MISAKNLLQPAAKVGPDLLQKGVQPFNPVDRWESHLVLGILTF